MLQSSEQDRSLSNLSAFKSRSVIYSKYPHKFSERKNIREGGVFLSQSQRESAEYDLGITVLLVCKCMYCMLVPGPQQM